MIKKYSLFLLVCAFGPSLKIQSMDYSKALFAAGCLGFGGVTATLYGYAFKDQLIPAGDTETRRALKDKVDAIHRFGSITRRFITVAASQQPSSVGPSSGSTASGATQSPAQPAMVSSTAEESQALTPQTAPRFEAMQQERRALQTTVDRQFKQKSAFNYVLDGTVLFGITSLAALVYAKMPSVSPWFAISGLVGAGIGGYLMEARNTELKAVADIDVVGEPLADGATQVITTKNTIFTRLAAVGLGYCGGALFAKAFELGLSLQ